LWLQQGAAAVLDFYAIESPLAQPRNAVLGQVISAVTGVAIAKLFALSPHFEAVRWLGAALACASATALMALTGTAHPPAGATALLAVLDDDITRLGWFVLLPLLLGCGLMLSVALLVNNVQRRFPFYWWSPQETGGFWKGRRRKGEVGGRGEKPRHGGKGQEVSSGASTASTAGESERDVEVANREDEDSGAELTRTNTKVEVGGDGAIVITRGRVLIPEGLSLRPEEILSLETLSERL
jgi:hypothetical protein